MSIGIDDRRPPAPRLRARIGLVAFLAGLILAAGAAAQQPPAGPPLLDLVRVPLAVNASIPPNILVTLDDSGSMGWGWMPDGANYASNDCRRYNSSFNRIYFNPSTVYAPPLRPDGTSFPNANYNSAWIDGFRTALGTRNLATNYAASGDHQNSTNYANGWITTNFPAGVVSGSSRRAFYCTGTAASTVVLLQNTNEATRQNFANWFSYYRTRSLAARTALSTAFSKLDPGARVAWQNFRTNNLSNSRSIRSLDTPSWNTEFFNWLHTPRFSGNTPMNGAFLRAGRYVEENRGSNTTNPYFDEKYGRELSCRQTFHVMMTDGYGNVLVGNEGIGDYDTVGRGIHGGRSLAGPAARVYYSKNSGTDNAPGLADMAFYFWSRDLRPDLGNDVPAFIRDNTTGVIAGASGEDEIYFNPANDPATWQRMVNFMVTFGAGGSLPYTPATLMQIRQGTRNWPNVNGGARTIDDAWHAAVNSRGDFLSAEDPQELVDALTSILDNVSSRQAVTGVAGSSTFHRSGEYVYTASYDTNNWSGDLTATPIGTATPWPASAAGRLDVLSDAHMRTNRNVITWRPGGGGPGNGTQVAFNWTQLSAEQRTWLRFNPDTGAQDPVAQGQRRVDYIRGDRSLELSNGGAFRDRASRFGAIVDSNILYVEAPAHSYFSNERFPEAGAEYTDFRESYRDRVPMLYVGANDGMLHAINARTGEELWSFVPNKVIRNLSRLATPNFQFFPTVNGKLTVNDVYISGRWRTVLIGALGLGGQGAFAIDITEPNNPNVLWEIGDEHVDGRLGYNYGEISVSRLRPESPTASGRWIALLPSGYNHNATMDYSTRNMINAQPDPYHSDSGPALFVIDVQNGNVVRTLDSFPSTTPPAQGLSEVTPAEYHSSFEVDFAVGGDVNGNLWRYSLSQADADERGREQIERVLVGDPERPITAAPRIFPNVGSGMVFVFGTGKYLEPDDREKNITPQTLYGIQECLACPSLEVTRANLVEHNLTYVGDGHLGFDHIDVIPDDKRGWRFDLGFHGQGGIDLRGERVLERPYALFALGLVFVTTYYPSDDPCSPLGGSVTYALSAYSGGYPFGTPDPDDPTRILPAGTPPFIGAPPPAVSDCIVDCDPADPTDPNDPVDPGSGAPIMFDSRGCVVLNGNPTPICIQPARRGWRELPLE